MYYSKSKGGFYTEEIHGTRLIEMVTTDQETGEVLDRWMESNPDCKIPADAVAINDEIRVDLLAAQSAGKLIIADANGYPIAIDPPAPTPDELIAQASESVRAERDQKLLSTNWLIERHNEQVSAGVATKLNVDEYRALLIYRQALRDIPAQANFPHSVAWPTL